MFLLFVLLSSQRIFMAIYVTETLQELGFQTSSYHLVPAFGQRV